MPIPPPYDNPPSIGPEFNLFVWAFDQLSRERDPTTVDGKHVSVKRIRYSAIRDWAEFHGLTSDSDLLEELYTFIPALDTLWVEHEAKSIRSKAGKKHGKPA
jgi:hypothetical protein